MNNVLAPNQRKAHQDRLHGLVGCVIVVYCLGIVVSKLGLPLRWSPRGSPVVGIFQLRPSELGVGLSQNPAAVPVVIGHMKHFKPRAMDSRSVPLPASRVAGNNKRAFSSAQQKYQVPWRGDATVVIINQPFE